MKAILNVALWSLLANDLYVIYFLAICRGISLIKDIYTKIRGKQNAAMLLKIIWNIQTKFFVICSYHQD